MGYPAYVYMSSAGQS